MYFYPKLLCSLIWNKSFLCEIKVVKNWTSQETYRRLKASYCFHFHSDHSDLKDNTLTKYFSLLRIYKKIWWFMANLSGELLLRVNFENLILQDEF